VPSHFSARRYSLWLAWLGGFSQRSAALRLLKVEADINGILPATRRAPAIYFVSPLSRLRSALGGNCILRSTALGSFLAAGCQPQNEVLGQTDSDLRFGGWWSQ
jgi:hypothetical protein